MDVAVPLPARTDVSTLALRAVGAATAAAMELAGVEGTPDPDPARVAIAYSSERWLRIAGERPVGFAPLSAFFATRDGWVRTHANYPHHRAALLRALRLGDEATRDDVSGALASHEACAVGDAVRAAGGLCTPVLAESAEADAAWRRTPTVALRRLGPAPARPLPSAAPAAPLRGVRVLDLTRVIAGPVATRTLALLGADVLRIDPPALAEIPAQHLDTGHGKRSALLDLRTPDGASRLDALLADADIVALGYRPAALARLGLDPERLARRHPGIVVLRLSAWGDPDRRGFDSLVQAASGIALVEGTPDGPGALPAQALDHSAGYLLASAALRLLARRAAVGGSWLAETSLRRIAAELLGMPRTEEPGPARLPLDAVGHTQTFTVAGARVTTAAPAVRYPGGPERFTPPRPWGGDDATWA